MPASPARPDARPRSGDFAAMTALALPVVVVQLGLMGMGVVDSIIVGHVSARALAAVALGNLAFMSVIAFGMGALLALDPLVSQALGDDDHPAVRRTLQRGLVLAAAISVPTMAVLLPSGVAMNVLRQPADIVPVAAAYARICIPGVAPFLAFVVFRQTLQAMRRVRPVVVVIVVANVVNAVLDWLLVYGPGGLPALGPLGSAWASTACRWLLALGLLVAAHRELAPHLGRLDRAALQPRPLLRILRLAAPIGVQFQLEFAAFGVIALLMGWMGTDAMAAHQVAINLAALTFMVPLGISAAAAVLVGHAVGRRDAPGARRAAAAGLVCGGTVMAVSAGLFLAFPAALAAIFTDAPGALAIAAGLIPVAGVFQVFDGLQVVATGILRGIGDTRAPMAINLLGFWLIGMPVSVVVGFSAGLGPAGLWWGLVAGLGSVAVLLVARVRHHLRRDLERIVVD